LSALPSISVVIPNWNGAEHLPECLSSVGALDYPQDRFEVIVVDNGSTDGSRTLIDRLQPRVRLIANEKNLGFAAACNLGAQAATSDCVAFLNNDMRVDRRWLRELAAAYDRTAGYVCVAGVILDWDGDHLDFGGGWVNFHAYAGQSHFGAPLDEARIEDGRDLPFACGGSMLVDRAVMLELGGFDPAYFAFFEDVDFGWRLWLAGYKVRLAGRARSFHRHHGTASAIPLHQRELLYERNALFTLIKNVSDDNLATLLAPTLFLLLERCRLGLESAPGPFAIGTFADAPTEAVARVGLAPLHAACEVLESLPQLLERRREVQRRRKRDDEEIFALFGRPFARVADDERYQKASAALRDLFGLDELLSPRRRRHSLQRRFSRVARQ